MEWWYIALAIVDGQCKLITSVDFRDGAEPWHIENTHG